MLHSKQKPCGLITYIIYVNSTDVEHVGNSIYVNSATDVELIGHSIHAISTDAEQVGFSISMNIISVGIEAKNLGVIFHSDLQSYHIHLKISQLSVI